MILLGPNLFRPFHGREVHFPSPGRVDFPPTQAYLPLMSTRSRSREPRYFWKIPMSTWNSPSFTAFCVWHFSLSCLFVLYLAWRALEWLLRGLLGL